MKIRTLVLGGLLTLLFVVLICHIYKVQVADGAKWLKMAEERWETTETFNAKRGTIVDRSGTILAMDAIAYNVSINPKVIQENDIASDVSYILSTVLGMEQTTINEHLNAKRENGEYYSNRELRKGGWNIDKSVADALKEAREKLKKELVASKKTSDTGIYITETYERFYPHHERASQVIGYISLDGENRIGLESIMNDKLTGTNGYITYKKDGKRVQIQNSDVDYVQVQDGKQIGLTIDSDIQYYAEEALSTMAETYDPKSATVIVANPKTMEIYAMANYPTFDPNAYWESPYGNMYNHAVSSLYEPGSTFKIVTLAAAIEEGAFNPNETYMSGSITVPGEPKPFRDHNRVGWGQITFLDGLKYSSNVAFVKLGFEKLGGDKLRQYYNSFGFGQKSGIELPNEATGTVRFQYNSEIAAASFGQGGVLVTPIQQVAAVAAVANGGKLMKPYLVKSITDTSTNTTTLTEPKMVRQVISEETSKLAGEYLEQVVSDQEKGTGRSAYIEGYRVAGKTGTAQKVINGQYSSSKYVVSFIGYAPVDDPQLVIYVIVDEPNDSLAGGGKVAAPVFREVMLRSLHKLDIAPDYVTTPLKTDEDENAPKVQMIEVPDIVGMKGVIAKEKIKNVGLEFEFIGDGAIIEQQVPSGGSLAHPGQKVYFITEKRENIAIPDLTGSALRDALEISSLLGIKLQVEGSGYIYKQQVIDSNSSKVLKVFLSPLKQSEQYNGELDHVDEEAVENENTDESDANSSESEKQSEASNGVG